MTLNVTNNTVLPLKVKLILARESSKEVVDTYDIPRGPYTNYLRPMVYHIPGKKFANYFEISSEIASPGLVKLTYQVP